MNKLFIITLIALIALPNALGVGDLITSAGREFPSADSFAYGSVAQGSWYFKALYNNGTTQQLVYGAPQSFWVDNPALGTGLVTNRSETFEAETGVSLVFDSGTIAGARTSAYNTTITWVSNHTGPIIFSGWYQRTPLTTDDYNLSIWLNTQMLSSVIKTDATNYTYYELIGVAAGDNVSLVLAPANVVTGPNPYLNITGYVQVSFGRDIVVNSPANNTENNSIVQPISYTPSYGNGIVNASVWINQSGWTRIAGNASIVTNNSLNWINATLQTYGQYIFAVQVCGVDSICNYSSNYTLNLTPVRLIINAFNESNQNRILFNVTISNGSNTTLFSDPYFWFNLTRNELPIGNVKITISNTTYGFSSRNYYADFNKTGLNLTAFLSVSSILKEVDVTVKDYAGNLKAGYYVKVLRSYNGTNSYSVIAEEITGVTGIAIVYLDDSYLTYRFDVYDASNAFVQSFSPVSLAASNLIATNVYGLTFILGQAVYPEYGAANSIIASCTFTNATGVFTCTIEDLTGFSIGNRLTLGNLTASGFMQTCSVTSSLPSTTLTCSGTQTAFLNTTFFKYKLEIFYPDGSTYVAAQGSYDFRTSAFQWGQMAFIAFMFLVIIFSALGAGSPVGIYAMVGLAVTIAKILNIFNVEWAAVIGLWCIIFLAIFKTRA